MRRSILIALVVLSSLGVPAQAQVKSAVSIDRILVTPGLGGQYKIVMKGTVTLGTNDTYTAIQVVFHDPNNVTVAPFVSFVPPQPGQSSPITAFSSTTVTGTWNASITMTYMRADSTSLTLYRQYIVEVSALPTASTSWSSLAVALPPWLKARRPWVPSCASARQLGEAGGSPPPCGKRREKRGRDRRVRAQAGAAGSACTG